MLSKPYVASTLLVNSISRRTWMVVDAVIVELLSQSAAQQGASRNMQIRLDEKYEEEQRSL